MPTKPEAVERSEWIVQANLPPREIQFTRSSQSGRSTPARIHSTGDRDANLRNLFDFLTSVLEVPPVLLKSAGAVSVTASPHEIERISSHPLVKRIDQNRRLKL
jgi:hypothetical protein